MSGVRIKDLQSAKSVIEQGFDQFEFLVDSPDPDATLKLSGAELKKAIGTEKHINPLEEADGLPGELEKKFDKAGGTITGDMRVTGNAQMKNLSIEEYLEVPKLKYNRIIDKVTDDKIEQRNIKVQLGDISETIAQNCILQSYSNSYTGKYVLPNKFWTIS